LQISAVGVPAIASSNTMVPVGQPIGESRTHLALSSHGGGSGACGLPHTRETCSLLHPFSG
jgi:hypothetical protein